MGSSKLATYTRISPNKTSPRNHRIDRITIHCTAFQGTARQIADINSFQKKNIISGASCNYAVGRDGSIALVVDENDRSWCSSSKDNDHRAITIEVSSDNVAPYKVTDEALEATIKLIQDICFRNGIRRVYWYNDKDRALRLVPGIDEAVFTLHRWFKNKACPGEYLIGKHQYIADSVNNYLCAPVGAKLVEIPSDNSYRVKVIVDELNIRNEPSAAAGIVGVVKKNEVYTIVSVSGSWGKLKSGAGWINCSSKYVTRI